MKSLAKFTKGTITKASKIVPQSTTDVQSWKYNTPTLSLKWLQKLTDSLLPTKRSNDLVIRMCGRI